MIDFPDRLGPLIQQLEAGTDPTPDELRRVERLQLLDLAKVGQDFAHSVMATEDAQTAAFAAALEG